MYTSKIEALCILIAVKDKDGTHKMVEIMETNYQQYWIDFENNNIDTINYRLPTKCNY